MQIEETRTLTIGEFFDMVEKEGGTYAVETPNGFVKLGDLVKKTKQPSCIIRVDGESIGVSVNHLFMTENGWKYAGKLNLENDKIQYNGKFVPIVCREMVEDTDTYDFEVLSEEHAYLANGFTSHNTAKTSLVKQLAKVPIDWDTGDVDAKGKPIVKHYDGFQIVDIPLAQIEEMGDVLGYPVEEIKMQKNGVTKWIKAVDSLISSHMNNGWETDGEQRTIYAPPSWVPKEERPGVLLFDDGNRASQRIIKGLMQLVQDYRTISWEIPQGWTIVFTGNPDNRFNQVTSMDTAQLSRMKFISLVPDADEWAVWAENNDIDKRLISFVLRYPEMMIGSERTNPRSLAEFGRALKRFPKLDAETSKKCSLEAYASLDNSTVETMIVFLQKSAELVIDPKTMLTDYKTVKKHVEDLMSRAEPRIDIINVMNDRLYAYIVSDNYVFDKKHIENIQSWILDKNLPADSKYAFVRRLCYSDCPYRRQMLSGNDDLLEVVRVGMGDNWKEALR